MGATKRPPQNAGLIKDNSLVLSFFGFCNRGKIFLYASVINAEELVGSGSHVDVIRLALCPFLIHESINGIVSRRTLNKPVHNLEEGLAQIGGTFLCGGHTFADTLPGIVLSGVNTAKGCQGSVKDYAQIRLHTLVEMRSVDNRSVFQSRL